MTTKETTEFMDGWVAHLNGFVLDANPYHEKLQAFSFRRWLSGWCSRHDAIKHGKPLDLDDAIYD